VNSFLLKKNHNARKRLSRLGSALAAFELLLSAGTAFAGAPKECISLYRSLPPLTFQQTDYTCGAACVVSMLKFIKGRSVDEHEVARILGTNEAVGTLPDQMVYGLLKLNLSAKASTGVGISMLKQGFLEGKNYILLVDAGGEAHWVVFAGMKDEKVVLMDPWKEHKDYLTYSEQDFLKIWETTLDGQKMQQLGIEIK
jgi:predicted double-glycine peptidase